MPQVHTTDAVPGSGSTAGTGRWSPRTRLAHGRIWAKMVAALFAVYGAAAAVLLGAGWWWGDATWWLYLSNLSAFYWLAPTIPMAAFAALRRWWQVAALCMVGAVGWLVTFGPQFVPQPVPATATLRIASYNVSPLADVDHVAELVDRVQPDLLLLQEVVPEAQDDLAALLPYHDFAEVNAGAPGGGGTVVLSRLPIVDSQPIDGLPADSRPANIVTVDTGDGTAAVVSMHLASPCSDCTDDPPRIEEQGLASEAETRRVEVDRIAQGLPSGPLVVGGDLNSSTLNTPRRRLLETGLVDLHRAVGSGPGFTRHDWHAWFRIDWLLASRDVTPVREWVDRQEGSDHSPVVADIALPE